MRRIAVIMMVMVGALAVAQQQADDTDAQLAELLPGTWELYRTDTVGDFSLNEYRTAPPTSSFVDATLVLNDDGTMTADSQTLRFQGWAIRTGFVSFQTPSGNSFYKVRNLTEDVLYLVSVVITERNRQVTAIEVNPAANLILVRAE